MKSIAEIAANARLDNRYASLIEAIPYAKLLGIQTISNENSREDLLFHLPARQSNIGNPTLPALHGGAIGGFLEMSGTLYLLMEMETLKTPKVIDFSIDYVRPGRFLDTYAACRVVRQGRKLVNVAIEAWQQNRDEPIATARVHFLLD